MQLDAAQPQRAHRRALACVYHVADVIEALRVWARDHDVADGQLTVLAIEPRERQPEESSDPNAATLREFAFSTIPLRTVPSGPAPRQEPGS